MRAAPPPPVLDRSRVPFVPAMDDNNVLGDCTAVGVANAARGMAALDGFGINIPTDRVVALYSASTGYVPGDPATDQGGVELDVLGYQASHGFDTGDQAPLVGAFATFDPRDRVTFANVMAKFGTAYLGVNLASADLDTSAVWDTATPGDQTPGSWGGHCLLAWDYTGLGDTDTVRLATWGTLQPCTWRWLADRCEEAHVLIWRQLMKANALNFAGLDYDGLRATNLAWADA
jgi:hypothetical protein